MSARASPVHHVTRRRGNPVSASEYCDWFDSDGRLVSSGTMRKVMFHVGVAPSCRPCIWKFLLGLYPSNSTRRDQKTIDLENRANYNALRQRWHILDKTIQVPNRELSIHDHPTYMELSDDDSADPIYPGGDNVISKSLPTEERDVGPSLEACLDQNGDICSQCHKVIRSHSLPSNSTSQTVSQATVNKTEGETSDQTSTSVTSPDSQTSADCAICQQRSNTECKCDCHGSWDDLTSDELALLKILDFPSRVYAARRPVQLETSYPKAKRVILRDVSRTDRNYHYFTHKRNLRKVHRILMIYAMFHPEIGYAQGMNDILARFLVVTDSEVDSYWLFSRYMEHKREDFLEDTMMKKVALVKKLVKEIDKELYSFFSKSDCHDYLFCHRWLLLDFKREFEFEDGVRMFEVLCTHYLELNSDKARVETDKVIAREFELDAGETRSERSEVNLEFTFDLFVCVAILTMNSVEICQSGDAAGIYGCLNGLSMNMVLNDVLTQAEELFYKYCRQNITRGFADIDLPS